MSEYREFKSEVLSLRTKGKDEFVLEGYFVTYNKPAPYSQYSDEMEQIKPGAFGDTLNKDIRCLYNHNPDIILGRTSAGTLELEERDDGLYGKVKINMEDSQARDIYARVQRGDIRGCSFGAYVAKESLSKDKKTWTLEELHLIEVSICPYPFYDSTTMEARSKKIKQLERKEKEITEFTDNKFIYLKRRYENVAKWRQS